MIRRVVVLFGVLLSGVGVARADEVKFVFAKPEEVKGVAWKASAQLGLLATTGNSRTLTFSLGAALSRNDGKNKLAIDASAAYARSSALVASDTNMDGVIEPSEISRSTKETANSWLAKLRYDRFLTKNNSLFAAVLAGQDQPAGRELIAEAQAGYARELYKSPMHDLSAEIGYDFSYVSFYTPVDTSVSIHSARVFAGYTLTLSKETGLTESLEALFNLSPMDTPTGHAAPLEGTRVNERIALSTVLYKALSFRFSFTARYDNHPAPLKELGLPFAVGFHPAADKLDTITEAALIVSFL